MKLVGSVIAVLLVVVGCWLYAQPALPPMTRAPLPTPLSESDAPQPATAPIAGDRVVVTLPDPVRERALVDTVRRRYSIRGVVTRAGVGQPGREVVCFRELSNETQKAVSARDGTYCFEVDPGKYEVFVPHEFGSMNVQQRLLLLPGGAQSQWMAARAWVLIQNQDRDVHLQLPPGAMVISVRNASTHEPVVGATVVWGSLIPFRAELHFVTDAQGYLRIADVDLGQYSLSATARAFQAAQKNVTVVQGGAALVVELLLQPACAVDVVLVDQQGQAIAVSRAQVIALRAVGTGTSIYANRKQVFGSERPLESQFDGLAAGRYRVHLDDDLYGLDDEQQTVRFVPCVANGEHLLEVQPGILQRAQVPVEPRAYATLRAVDARKEILRGQLRVECLGSDGVLRRVLPAPWQQGEREGNAHFEGYLARGTYSLTFTKGELVHSEQLYVDGGNVDHSLQLSW